MVELASITKSAASAAVLSAGALAYAVRVPSCTWLAPSVSHGSRKRRAIALTFDDGPSESTPELLEILADCGAAASFFQCGANVRRLPSVAQEVAHAGHEIGNHTDAHEMLALKSPGHIYDQLARAQEAIEYATGVLPRYFRAPYGVRWFGLRGAQRRLKLRGVMWSTIALDWKWPAEDVVARLLEGATPGAILCLHDGRELAERPDVSVTLDAVRELLPKFSERGFEFLRLTDLLAGIDDET